MLVRFLWARQALHSSRKAPLRGEWMDGLGLVVQREGGGGLVLRFSAHGKVSSELPCHSARHPCCTGSSGCYLPD